MALILRKKSTKVWTHEFNGRPVYITPKANFNTPNETFLVIEQFGSKLGVYNQTTGAVEGVPVADVTVYNDTVAGGAETFSTVTELALRLEELAYPAFYREGEITSIAGYITFSTGLSYTGAGTLADPFVVTSSGAAVSKINRVVFSGATITAPSGFAGAVINLNDINTAVTYTVAGTLMTITGGATNGDILIF